MLSRPRWRLQTSLVAVALIAIALWGIVQFRTAQQEERTYHQEMMRSLARRKVKHLLGERGMWVLAETADVQVFRVRAPQSDPTRQDEPQTIHRFSGAGLGSASASRLSRALLDGAHYIGGLNAHPSAPEIGLRFTREDESVDVLLARSVGPTLDVRAIVRDKAGNIIHRGEYATENQVLVGTYEQSLDE
jgi:hypothetical protein